MTAARSTSRRLAPPLLARPGHLHRAWRPAKGGSRREAAVSSRRPSARQIEDVLVQVHDVVCFQVRIRLCRGPASRPLLLAQRRHARRFCARRGVAVACSHRRPLVTERRLFGTRVARQSLAKLVIGGLREAGAARQARALEEPILHLLRLLHAPEAVRLLKNTEILLGVLLRSTNRPKNFEDLPVSREVLHGYLRTPAATWMRNNLCPQLLRLRRSAPAWEGAVALAPLSPVAMPLCRFSVAIPAPDRGRRPATCLLRPRAVAVTAGSCPRALSRRILAMLVSARVSARITAGNASEFSTAERRSAAQPAASSLQRAPGRRASRRRRSICAALRR